MRRRPVSVNHLFVQRPALQKIADAISMQKAIQAVVKRHLPAELADHLSAVAVDGPTLTLFTDSPVWGTRLRYLRPQLLKGLAGAGHAYSDLRVRLQPPSQSQGRRPRNTARCSNAGAAIIHATAVDTKQPDLRAALIRLAKRLKQ